MEQPDILFNQCIDLMEKMARNGLIHSDFNEFNLMVTHENKLIVIDFPQMVSTSHLNADFYFQRDQDCINTYFNRRFKCSAKAILSLDSIVIEKHLDIEVKASGFLKKELRHSDDIAILDNY
jgi:RIO kinase 2